MYLRFKKQILLFEIWTAGFFYFILFFGSMVLINE